MEMQISQPMMSETIGELAKALCKAQKEMTAALKDSKNPFFKSNYADLKTCVEASREPLANNELAISQTTLPDKDGVICVTTLMHSSGEWIRGSLFLPSKKHDDPQQFGSCMTYARRYGRCAIIEQIQADDDANSARPPQKNVVPIKDNKRLAQEKLYAALKEYTPEGVDGDALAMEIVNVPIKDFGKLTIKQCEAGINIINMRKEEQK